MFTFVGFADLLWILIVFAVDGDFVGLFTFEDCVCLDCFTDLFCLL